MKKTQFLLLFPAQFYTFCFASCGEKNAWKRSMKAAGDYLVEVMGHSFASINYVATTAATKVVLKGVIPDSVYALKARAMARQVVARMDDGHFITAYGYKDPRGVSRKYMFRPGGGALSNLWLRDYGFLQASSQTGPRRVRISTDKLQDAIGDEISFEFRVKKTKEKENKYEKNDDFEGSNTWNDDFADNKCPGGYPCSGSGHENRGDQ